MYKKFEKSSQNKVNYGEWVDCKSQLFFPATTDKEAFK